MYKLLFVDDEVQILEGIQDSLRKYRKKWNMTFVCGGEAAIAALGTVQYDVVICDMRMPQVDGVAVLSFAKKRCPATVRIVLSGYSEVEHTISVSSLAHQYLTKPCDQHELETVIQRCMDFSHGLNNPVIREICGNVVLLPVNDTQNRRLLDLFQSESTSISDIAATVEVDIALTAKLLQLVNSAFFRQQCKIDSATDAAMYLGTDLIKTIINATQFSSATESVSDDMLEWVTQLQQHSLLTAIIAKDIMRDTEFEDAAFTAALLHELGALVLASERPELLDSLMQADTVSAEATPNKLHRFQAELGAYLLNIWGLPYPIVEAVAFSAHPSARGSDSLDVVGAVHIANYLAELCTSADNDVYTDNLLDELYLESLGINAKMDDWIESAKKTVEVFTSNNPVPTSVIAA